MTNRLSWIDWFRIERTVWTLDTLVQSLPGRTRRAIRVEMHVNLRAAAGEVGAVQAIRQLGSLRRLAVGYLESEYGEGRPRPRWLRALLWMVFVELALLATGFVGHAGFMAGIEAANPRPDGTYTWNGLPLLGIGGDATYVDGRPETFGVSFALWSLVFLVAALIVGGRLWRIPAAWWRARRRAQPVVTAR